MFDMITVQFCVKPLTVLHVKLKDSKAFLEKPIEMVLWFCPMMLRGAYTT